MDQWIVSDALQEELLPDREKPAGRAVRQKSLSVRRLCTPLALRGFVPAIAVDFFLDFIARNSGTATGGKEENMRFFAI